MKSLKKRKKALIAIVLVLLVSGFIATSLVSYYVALFSIREQISSSCKKIRNDKGYWLQLEDYFHTHTDAEFSHCICPECARTMYPELYEDDETNDSRQI